MQSASQNNEHIYIQCNDEDKKTFLYCTTFTKIVHRQLTAI